MKIPVPQRGQPLDVDYIYQIINQLNTLTNQISANSTTLSTVDNGIVGQKDVTTNNLRFVAITKNIKKDAATANQSQTWFIDFSPQFLYVPVVTATAVNKNGSAAGDNLSVVIKNVSTSRVDGSVRFGTSGNIDVNVNIIAIGTT